MTLNSMTGFARTEGVNDNCTWAWEAKSVNAKGMDARLRLPSGFETFDVIVRENLKKRFRRGAISVSLNVNWHHSTITRFLWVGCTKVIPRTLVYMGLHPGPKK